VSTNRKIKIALLSFLSLSAMMLAGGLLYLQSESFGNSVKQMISERSPRKLGVVGDFSNLKLYLFPPGVGVVNPKIHIERENVSQIPIEGQIEAKELKVSFAPIQMFSGLLQVSEIEVRGGAVQGRLYAQALKAKTKVKSSAPLSWQDLVQLQINGFRFVDTYLNIQTELPGDKKEEFGAELVVKELVLSKQKVHGRNGFVSTAIVNAVKVTPPESMKGLPVKEANQLQWNMEITDRGILLSPFIAELSGIRLKLKGEIDGNILDPKGEPQLHADVESTSDLETFFLANLNQDQWRGDVQVKAQVQASLRNIVETLKGQFSVQGEGLKWDRVSADRLTLEGGIDLKSKRLELKSLEATEQNKTYGLGRLKVLPMKVPLSFNEPFSVQAEIENGDIHWLGGVVAKEVCPLESSISGKVQAQFTPDKSRWKLKTSVDLSVAHFGLTNQKLGVPRPMVFILKPPRPILLKGGLDVTPLGIDFREMTVSIQKTQLKVAGGVHGDTGFDFHARGPIDLKEVHEIAGNVISGEGDLDTHIHGTAENLLLDFDTLLNDANYIGLHFGKVKGRITYDDGISELRFSDIQANHKNTFYSLSEGSIDLAGSDELYLPLDIHSGRVEDLSEILASLVKKVSWYPYQLKGEIHGTVEVGGKIATPELMITAKVEGSDWSWFGEKARRVKLELGYDHGTYFARNANILKSSGSVYGAIDFKSSTEEMSWDFRTENFSFNDLDFIERLEIPARSKIEIRSIGSGRMDHLKSKTEGRVYDTEIKGENYDSSRFNLEVGENTLRANGNVFGDQLTAQVKYALSPKQPSSVRIDLNDFDFSPAILILNPRLLDDPELIGKLTGHMSLDFLSNQSELARGELALNQYRLEKSGFRLKLLEPIILPIQLGYFQFNASHLQFNQGQLTMSGEGRKGDVDIRLEGDTDLGISEFFTSSILSAKGKADTDIRIFGPLKNLKLNGEINLSGGQVLLRWMQSPLEDVDGTIRLNQGTISVENLDAYLGEEVFSMSGKIQTFTDRFPELDLRAQLDNNKIKMIPFDFIQPKGQIAIKGTEPPYMITGALEVSQALWTRSFSQSSTGTGSRGDRFLPKDQDKKGSGNLFAIDLNVNANQGFFVRNEILDAEFKGKVRLVGEPESPSLLGEGQLVQGKVLFKDRPFVFETARIVFDDPYAINPRFNASAMSEVNQYKIRVLASGRASQWKLDFSSTPYLPENEIFSVLSSGTSSSDTSRFKSRDRSLVSQGEAASLILNTMDFSKDVQQKTGFQFDVQEAVDSQTANSIFRPQNLSDNIASPKLVLKRKVGRNVMLSFGSTVGLGTENQKEVNAEYKVTNGVSMLGVWNNIEEVNTRETRTSFGLDLKFNRRFK